MRRALTFQCEGSACAATVDSAAGATGLLIVSGGNEVRTGAHDGMARIAARIAAAGAPVWRFDRRGVGDSEGANRGYAGSGPDIAAAAAAFRAACPGIRRLVGFGNCDAATALALFGKPAGLDALLLANPWAVETPDDLPPPAAIRRHYRHRLRAPGAWRDLVVGRVAFGRLARGLIRAARPPRTNALAD
ncbi:hydrolase 1, exosortase A system-associated, partial [Sphingomonas flavalba]|uniref:hydrolase 1, exosortase A system-associated n=1 Tax=Sphingomonas flavalba TaxID=2559804 RepID=UPI00109D9C16